MAIKFNCPHCKRALTVKDDSLAGKKAACTGCKKIIVIPQPTPAALAEDVEALAAAALKEGEAAAAAAPTQTIDFECPQCGEAIKVSREFAGKNAPCPECRRIVKVPMPKTKEGAEWRQKDTLPSGARRDTEPAPEGAWESSRARGVSAEALIEAGVVKEKKRPGLTPRQKVYRWSAAGAVAAAVLIGGIFAFSAWSQNKQDVLVDQALKAADAEGKAKELTAVANRAAGEFYLRTGIRDSADKAQKHYAKARAMLGQATSKANPEADLLLADVAVAQVGLGGDAEDVAHGKRLKWDQVKKELQQTLAAVSSNEGRLQLLRLVSRRLFARGRNEDPPPLAGLAGGASEPEAALERAEALAVVGIEFLRTGDKDTAGKLAARAELPYAVKPDDKHRPPLSPSTVALCIALGRDPPRPGKAKFDPDWLMVGQAAGFALKGDLSTARGVIKGPAEARFMALVLVAEVSGDAADIDAAVNLLDTELKGNPGVAWYVYRLALAAAKLGQPERVMRIAEHATDPGLKSRAQFEAVRVRLEGAKDMIGDAALGRIGNAPLLQAQAREALARHDARLDYGGTLKAVDGWDEAMRPFGWLGAVLGEQDAKGK
jgi:DNA-directed RNA polymerase subunit M/transcription elongation factor TFIIS